MAIMERAISGVLFTMKGIEGNVMTYYTKGTCSTKIDVTLDADHTVREVKFTGGCSGNTQGVASLVTGMKAEDAIAKMEGIRCGFKPTSCPDQLAQALKQAITEL